MKFRQNNQFFYLTGVEVPRAILVIDGRAKSSTLFLNPRDERAERSEGPVLTPGPEAEKLTGINRVGPRDEFAAALDQVGADGRPHALPSAPAGGARRRRRRPTRIAHASRRSRIRGTAGCRAKRRSSSGVKAEGAVGESRISIRSSTRCGSIKSPREIALIREATRIAGLGIMEAMRSAQPGMYEYELEAIADYVFKKHNAQGIGYFALVAAGKNAAGRTTTPRRRRSQDGDARAVRLRAGLQVLHLRRHPDVPGRTASSPPISASSTRSICGSIRR